MREQMVSVTFHSVKICPQERQREWFIWFIWLAVQRVKDIALIKEHHTETISLNVPRTSPCTKNKKQKTIAKEERTRESTRLLHVLVDQYFCLLCWCCHWFVIFLVLIASSHRRWKATGEFSWELIKRLLTV